MSMTSHLNSDLFGIACMTTSVTETISQCIVNRSDFCHAFQFGGSFFCHHPRHIEPRVPVGRAMDRKGADYEPERAPCL